VIATTISHVDIDLITRIAVALEREGVRYKVFGGIALNAHGLARGTQHLDLFVDPTADNLARLRAALKSLFDDPAIDEITAADLAGDYPAIQYVTPDGSFSIDILSRLGEACGFDDLEAIDTLWQSVPMTVVSPRQLYLMKRDTVRPQDRADAARLRVRFSLED